MMKTFKLISFQIIDGETVHDIPLKDGLIINREDVEKRWLIETFIAQEYVGVFEDAFKNGNELFIQVVITRPENDPAPFRATVVKLKKINESYSVLLEGYINKSRNDYAELLLTHLLDKGITGDQLLEAFKTNMVTKPKLPAANKE
ncbi:YwpF-like protein [Bacillus oleivorans]|uniref:YwpF-like protein n=2 Tax=Bacillus oleivorans TaxID=1448271 RepID=A0A285CII6_9BACI|nr:YwpF-like family protein [Bacillus oleivorans]SNX67329.1 YwpF-like protein [Bacillus oleivorans]